MKRNNFLCILMFIALFSFINNDSIKAANLPNESGKTKTQLFDNAAVNTKEQVMGWLIIDILGSYNNYIEKSLTEYYGGFVPYWLTTSSSQVLEATYCDDCACFNIKLQVEPYLGAHDPIGLDNFDFKIYLADNKITLEKYEHIKSFKIPEYVKNQHLNLNLP